MRTIKIIHAKRIAKVLIILVTTCLSVTNSFGQQDPTYTNYMFNTLAINPGYAGTREAMSMLILHRSQWVGIKGAPRTNTITIHSPIKKYNLGVGLSLQQDEIGPLKQTGLSADFAYQIKIGPKVKLALGLKSGFSNYSANLNNLLLSDTEDDFFRNNVLGKTLPNFGFGTYLYHKKYYLGVSMPKLLTNSLSNDDISGGGLYRERRHFFITAGYVLEIHPALHFKPSMLVRSVQGAPLSIDLSANLFFMEKLWTGIYTRTGDSFGVILQYWLNNQLKVGYSYDYSISTLADYNSGSHEVLISYDLHFRKYKIKSPRYF